MNTQLNLGPQTVAAMKRGATLKIGMAFNTGDVFRAELVEWRGDPVRGGMANGIQVALDKLEEQLLARVRSGTTSNPQPTTDH